MPFIASRPAFADVTEALKPTAPVVDSAALVPAPAEPSAADLFLDLDFQLTAPPGFKFVDTQPAYDPDRRGPAPEPSPVRARFDSLDDTTVVSVVVRNAQYIRQSLLQVTDVSVFGSLEEAAQLLLPRGSRVLSGSVLQVALPPRQTALGPLELPPKCYYRYEFTTNTGLHVVMSIAAMKGRVYVCGGSTTAGANWDRYGPALRQATQSFRLRSDNAVL